MTSPDTVDIRIGISNGSGLDDAEEVLRKHGARNVEVHEREGVVPLIIPIVIAASIGTSALTQLVRFWLEKSECQQILDFRGGKLKMVDDCDHKNGKVIVVADKDTSVVISSVPEVMNLTEIAKTAITKGAEAAKAAVEAAGGKADVEETPSPLKTDLAAISRDWLP
jgi:hypothetical protein